jgi:hypothetical protein
LIIIHNKRVSPKGKQRSDTTDAKSASALFFGTITPDYNSSRQALDKEDSKGMQGKCPLFVYGNRLIKNS